MTDRFSFVELDTELIQSGDLDTRAFNRLKMMGVTTYDQLAKCRRDDIMQCWGIGPNHLAAIQRRLAERGYRPLT